MSDHHLHIDLLRHGQAEGGIYFRGSTDDPLTDAGWRSMHNVTQSYGPWQRVISSPLLRCSEFSDRYSKSNNLPNEIVDDLREIHFGEWEKKDPGVLYKEQPDELDAFWNNPGLHSPPEGENLQDFKIRVKDAWSNIESFHYQLNSSTRTLLIAHGGVIRMILSLVLNIPISSILKLELPLSSISRIQYSQVGRLSYQSKVCFVGRTCNPPDKN